jgi:Domain of unknown function (DUF4105)
VNRRPSELRSRLDARAWTRLWILLCACWFASPARAQLSLDLITVEPGAAIWERFGHTALRFHQGELDVVYSFGAAPFFDPGFLWKFARGEGEFLLVAESYATTLARYRDSDRTLMRQQLLLPEARVAELLLRLQLTSQPPGNRYLYDQLYDNCATRVRDLINRISDGALSRAARKPRPAHRYRDDTLTAMAGHPIGHWALDLIGGRHQDLPVTSFNEMYLPLALRDRVAEARVVIDGKSGPLAAPAQIVFARRGPALSRNTQGARVVMLALAFVLAFSSFGFMRAPGAAKRRLAACALVLSALWSGLFGLLVVPLSLLSHVHNFSPNENAGLFWPTDLCLAPFLYRACMQRRSGPVLTGYVALKLLCLVVLSTLKVLGVCAQHNLVFVGLALSFAASWCALVWPQTGLARRFASR